MNSMYAEGGRDVDTLACINLAVIHTCGGVENFVLQWKAAMM
jgi:hypothetical protein